MTNSAMAGLRATFTAEVVRVKMTVSSPSTMLSVMADIVIVCAISDEENVKISDWKLISVPGHTGVLSHMHTSGVSRISERGVLGTYL